jgi:hypothetical protein
MKITQVANICSGQDGAIYKNLLFRMDHKGLCRVYDLETLPVCDNESKASPLSEFILEGGIVPHSNAVFFGKERFEDADEFPLLYTNVYNNYASAPDPLRGVCCVYRVGREGDTFTARLVQVIRVGFVGDESLWLSGKEVDRRPYGNFVADTEKGELYAFTMRDSDSTTRYFSFDLPSATEGEADENGVKWFTLQKEDVKDSFDCPFHYFLQGACFKDGKIYSTEGFTEDRNNPPAFRVISITEKRQEQYIPLGDFGLTIEPELIDFCGETCYYADNHGNLYVVEF